jgi:hypothetical protein
MDSGCPILNSESDILNSAYELLNSAYEVLNSARLNGAQAMRQPSPPKLAEDARAQATNQESILLYLELYTFTARS